VKQHCLEIAIFVNNRPIYFAQVQKVLIAVNKSTRLMMNDALWDGIRDLGSGRKRGNRGGTF
jgi:hypothetical protein